MARVGRIRMAPTVFVLHLNLIYMSGGSQISGDLPSFFPKKPHSKQKKAQIMQMSLKK